MNTNIHTSHTLELVPASKKSLVLKDLTSVAVAGCEGFLRAHGIEESFRCLFVEDQEQDVRERFDCRWLSIAETERLAGGEEIGTPFGEVEAPGRLRLVRGHEGGVMTMVLLEFLPDTEVPDGMGFAAWFQLRFPESSASFAELAKEGLWVLLHGMWADETKPEASLRPDDSFLSRAVLNNHEELVEAILARQPKIEKLPGYEKSIEETALGIAMENTGMFGSGAGFVSACHRHYREDDFTLAEDEETWVPRAERIAERLLAAGAIDYSPMLEACRAGDSEVVAEMLKQGFPPNFSVYGHTTPLLEAVDGGHEDVCDLLLSHGANPNQSRLFSSSMTFGGEIYPLSLALSHPAIFKRLVDAGADCSVQRDDVDQTPALLRPCYDSAEEAEMVFGSVDFSRVRGRYGRSGVFYLNHSGLEQCRSFISAELVNEYDGRGMTPLLHAINSEDFLKVQLLIDMGADTAQSGIIWSGEINCLLNHGNTAQNSTQLLIPIQAALQIGDLEIVELLMEQGGAVGRSSLGLSVPSTLAEEDYMRMLGKLEFDLLELDGGIRLELSSTVVIGSDERTRHCEILLANLLICQPRATAMRYPEFVHQIDLVDWAEERKVHPALIEPLRSGCRLGVSGWLKYLDQTISELHQASHNFEQTLAEQEAGVGCNVAARDLLAPLMYAEQALLGATHRITGERPQPLSLVIDVCSRASGDSGSGAVRAIQDAKATGKVRGENFIDVEAENFMYWDTLDHGKLLQAVRVVAKNLETQRQRLSS